MGEWSKNRRFYNDVIYACALLINLNPSLSKNILGMKFTTQVNLKKFSFRWQAMQTWSFLTTKGLRSKYEKNK